MEKYRLKFEPPGKVYAVSYRKTTMGDDMPPNSVHDYPKAYEWGKRVLGRGFMCVHGSVTYDHVGGFVTIEPASKFDKWKLGFYVKDPVVDSYEIIKD